MLNEKDIIAINSEFANGNVINKSSLSYVINAVKRSNSWIKSVAYLVRGILIDHIFEEGNKRTASAVIVYYLEEKHYKYDLDEVNKIVIRIIKDNINDIKKIERLIENVIN